jgi:hypothetical protein
MQWRYASFLFSARTYIPVSRTLTTRITMPYANATVTADPFEMGAPSVAGEMMANEIKPKNTTISMKVSINASPTFSRPVSTRFSKPCTPFIASPCQDSGLQTSGLLIFGLMWPDETERLFYGRRQCARYFSRGQWSGRRLNAQAAPAIQSREEARSGRALSLEILTVDAARNADVIGRVFVKNHIDDLRIGADRVMCDLNDVPDQLSASRLRQSGFDMAFDERHSCLQSIVISGG